LHLTLNTGLESIVQGDRGCPTDVFDGVAVLSFESLEDMAAKGAEPAALAAAEELAADERRFIDHTQSRSGSLSTTPLSDPLRWAARDGPVCTPPGG